MDFRHCEDDTADARPFKAPFVRYTVSVAPSRAVVFSYEIKNKSIFFRASWRKGAPGDRQADGAGSGESRSLPGNGRHAGKSHSRPDCQVVSAIFFLSPGPGERWGPFSGRL